LFEPAAAEPPQRDLARLFDLKRRPGYYNADRKVALLRRDRKAPHDDMLVDFSHDDVQIELHGGGRTLACGDWRWRVTAAGQTLVPAGLWTAAAWRSDKEGDYLKIELPLSGGWKIERQILLARKERFLLLADALVGRTAEAAELHYAHSLPLSTEVALQPARETREVFLTAGKQPRATLVPPGLAEWRAEYCHAELGSSDGRLTLHQAAQGRNLYAPLWIDLDPRRLRRPVTWRRLTVGENLAAVPRDTAVGYRIQAGTQQWLIYRSLAPVGNRSVLGHNTYHSFVCLRLLPGGKTEPIVEIE
jgi:hypothetical protein